MWKNKWKNEWMNLLKGKWKNELIAPLKDKGRTMKLEYFLSNNYILAGMLIMLDVVLVLGGTYFLHLLRMLPAVLAGGVSGEMFSPIHMLPDVSGITLKKAGIVLFGLLVMDMVLAVRIKLSWSETHFNVGQKGVSRFANEDEIKQQYKAVEPLETPYQGNPGILISRIGETFYIDDSVVNNLILGITRSGKGELLVKSGIEIYSRAEFQPSLIVNDPKLEHYKVFAPILEKRGYQVYLLNASNPKYSMGFNLLTVAVNFYKKKDYDMAEQVVNALSHSFFDVDGAKGDMVYFTGAAAALCSAMILAGIADAFRADEEENQKRYEIWSYLTEEEKKKHPFRYRNDNEKTIHFYSILINFGWLVEKPVDKNGIRTLLDVYFEQRPADDRARMKFLGVKVAPGKTKSGVFSEMLRELDIFTLRNVAMMTAESSLDMAEIGFGERPIAVFLSTPSYDSSLYKLPTVFIRQMYYVLGKLCDDGKGKCDRQVKVILDEAGNMPNIELMKIMTTMGLGQNISFDVYLQNYEQLEEIYGKQIAETIKGNCGNHFYLQTNSEETSKSFSNMLGSKSIVNVQRAGNKLSFHKYYTESIDERPLLNHNELMELQEGETVIFRRSKRRDLKGNKIKPRPIFNSVENGRYLWYAYEYFPKETYPHPNDVNFMDICRESRADIRLDERVWDIEKSFRMFQESQKRRRKVKRLSDFPAYEELEVLLYETFGKDMEEKHGIGREMTVAEFADVLNRMELPEERRAFFLEKLQETG